MINLGKFFEGCLAYALMGLSIAIIVKLFGGPAIMAMLLASVAGLFMVWVENR